MTSASPKATPIRMFAIEIMSFLPARLLSGMG
jgi:hypothetical protein